MVGINGRKLIGLAIFLFTLVSAKAQVFWYEDGGLHTISGSIGSAIGIADNVDGFRTIVIIYPGASIGDDGDDTSVAILGISTAFIYGGSFSQDLDAVNGSSATILGGNFQDDLNAYHAGNISFLGGTVADDIHVYDQGTVNMTGGSVGQDFEVFDDGIATISGGTIQRNVSVQGGFLSISGGSFNSASGSLEADGGTIQIAGSNFAVNGSIVVPGNLSANTGVLTGTLLDGSYFSMNFSRLNGGTIEISASAIPEPAHYTALLGMIGLAVYSLRRRKHTR